MNINATLLGQVISFAIFVWFCMKYVWPPLIATIEERQKKIAADLSRGNDLEVLLADTKKRVEQELNDAKAKAAQLIEQANKRGNQMIEDAKAQAIAENERIKAQARDDIEQDINRARDALRAQVAALAVAGAEKILQAQVDEKAHAAMLNQLAAEL